jgi:GT2 family glycosyltransferase
VPDLEWLAAFAARFADQPDQVVGGQTVNALADNPFSTASQDLVTYLYNYFNAHPSVGRFFTSNNIAMPRLLFRDIGGFDKYFPFAAAEDRDFCDRWLARRLPLGYVPEAVVYHAHRLGWRLFWRQHFHYGRGAYHFHRLRARRQKASIKLEPLSFYLELIAHPFQYPQRKRRLGLFIAALTLLSQIANATGYFVEAASEARAPGRRPQVSRP